MDVQYQAKHLLETVLTLFLKLLKREGSWRMGNTFPEYSLSLCCLDQESQQWYLGMEHLFFSS